MRAHQTLTLIGTVLGILTTIGYWITIVGLDVFVTSFDESMRVRVLYPRSRNREAIPGKQG
jgi:hypothetical protein